MDTEKIIKRIDETDFDIDVANVKTTEERVKAVAVLVIVCVANIANVVGFAFDADMWVNMVLSVISAVSIVFAWWKNQNITIEAIQAQKFLEFLRSEAKHAKEE